MTGRGRGRGRDRRLNSDFFLSHKGGAEAEGVGSRWGAAVMALLTHSTAELFHDAFQGNEEKILFMLYASCP